MNDVPADGDPARPTRWQAAAETAGCFLPFVTPPVALGMGWWMGGVWVGLASLVMAGAFGLWLINRVFGRGQMMELGCVVLLILIQLALLVPAIQKIQQAAERQRRERETGWQVSPDRLPAAN
jgi:predicted membrane-bound spermidine synthase